MKKWAYYNDHDEDKCEWVRQLIKAGVVTDGEVDSRSIKDVQPDELAGFQRVHFFAGIAVWDYALNLAGWGDEPVWTGSCPCQPFSAAGKREGFNDERHLWPRWFRLIRECRPPVVFGEQVSAAIRGKDRAQANMQEMRGRETVLRVLHELQRQSPEHLQGMYAGKGTAAETVAARGGEAALSGMAGQESRLCAGERGEAPRQEEGRGIQPRHGGHSGTHRPWLLRDHGDPVRSYQASLMECAVTGPDQAIAGLYTGERAGDFVFLECDGEYLGHSKSGGSGQRDPRATFKAQRRTYRTFDRAFGGAAGWSWLELISTDLEREGYTLRPAVLGAHSAGAPHIRQRLYFVAERADTEHTIGRPEHEKHGEAHGRDGLGRSGDAGDGPDPANARRDDAGQHGSRPSLFTARPEQRGATGELCDANSERRERECLHLQPGQSRFDHAEIAGTSSTSERRDTAFGGLAMRGSTPGNPGHAACASEPIEPCELGDSGGNGGATGLPEPSPWEEGQPGITLDAGNRSHRGAGWLDPQQARSAAAAGATRGFWGGCDWWLGRDGKYRPIGRGISPLIGGNAQKGGRQGESIRANGEPQDGATQTGIASGCGSAKPCLLALADGTAADLRLVRDLSQMEPESGEARVLRLRGYGDAINAEQAAAFIASYREARGGLAL